MEKLILTAALTGAITVPTQSQHLPYTIEDLVDDGIACAKAGATVIHMRYGDPTAASATESDHSGFPSRTSVSSGCGRTQGPIGPFFLVLFLLIANAAASFPKPDNGRRRLRK